MYAPYYSFVAGRSCRSQWPWPYTTNLKTNRGHKYAFNDQLVLWDLIPYLMFFSYKPEANFHWKFTVPMTLAPTTSKSPARTKQPNKFGKAASRTLFEFRNQENRTKCLLFRKKRLEYEWCFLSTLTLLQLIYAVSFPAEAGWGFPNLPETQFVVRGEGCVTIMSMWWQTNTYSLKKSYRDSCGLLFWDVGVPISPNP